MIIIQISVQLALNLPTGTELGNIVADHAHGIPGLASLLVKIV